LAKGKEGEKEEGREGGRKGGRKGRKKARERPSTVTIIRSTRSNDLLRSHKLPFQKPTSQ